jgi:hypothetical protein
MYVSHETIYQSIFVQGRGALRHELDGDSASGNWPLVRRDLHTGAVHNLPRPPLRICRDAPLHGPFLTLFQALESWEAALGDRSESGEIGG